jgi:glutamate-1-semialdehyde 2,1-aminomutase
MDRIDQALVDLYTAYTERNPRSHELHHSASRVIPGATSRSVVDFRPFPFRVRRAAGKMLTDVDGHELVDFCGDYTAGLLGHNPSVVRDAVVEAMDRGWSLGAAHGMEIELAELLTGRFSSMDSVRFTNSGTEANLIAIEAALHHTGGSRVLVFEGGYHGSVLSFNSAVSNSALNVPLDFIVSGYNDVQGVYDSFQAAPISCVIVEPMLGSGGCIPASREFLSVLRSECDRTGCVLIFDEIMTSRLSSGGLQRLLGVSPDVTTLGKYLAGGMTFGAFGGRAEIMSHFDLRSGGALGHSGTFNNNVVSMAAGIAVLKNCLSEDELAANNAKGDFLRGLIADDFSVSSVPLWITGAGSMMHLHSSDQRWLTWLFHSLLRDGFYIGPKGFIALSFAISEDDCCRMSGAIRKWALSG